ncbi:MAG: acyltransferase family protein [Planctomycetaceae bacterium]|jgi:surface polysaccharide O-acyltransferase-like enzyme|nr:acyltransferase family protein [Planctomycetaceae bacterium]
MKDFVSEIIVPERLPQSSEPSAEIQPVQEPQAVQETQERILWADLLRVVSALMVIGLHYGRSIAIIPAADCPSMSAWFTTNFCDCFFLPAVSLFVMLSGYLLLGKKDLLNWKQARRIGNIVRVLLVWSAVYLLALYFTAGADRSAHTITVIEGIRTILAGNVDSHLWFLHLILGLYIAAPILHTFVRNADKKTLRYFVVLWCCASFVLKFLNTAARHLLGIDVLSPHFDFCVLSGFAGLFVIGYYLGYKPRLQMSKWGGAAVWVTIITLCLLAFTITLTADYFHTSRRTLYYYVSPVFTLGSFVVIQYIGVMRIYRKSFLCTIVTKISPLTLGVYLIHMLVLHLLGSGVIGIRLTVHSFHPLLSLPVGILTIFVVSAAAVYVIGKIPLVSRIVL